MNAETAPADDLLSQAADWFVRLRAPECTELDRAACRRWVAEHPDHARAWQAVQLQWDRLEGLRHRPAVADATREALQAAPLSAAAGATRVPAPAPGQRPASRRRRRGLAAVATAMAAAVLVAVVMVPTTRLPQMPATWLPITWTGERYVTATAQRQQIALPDGSSVLLDAESTLHVRYGLDRRDLVLSQGQAQFQVARDAQRPFVVKAADGEVRALGTEFQVRVVGDDVTVTLLEGTVAVDIPPVLGGLVASAQSTVLQAGEQVRYSSPRKPVDKAPADIEVAEAWPQGDLVFKRWKLDALVAEMNRHADTKIRIDDPTLQALVVNGRFRAGDQRALILALEHQWPIEARRAADGAIVLLRRPAA